ncbi:MAG: hypothetical protein P1V35_10675 [Planctomycetota bacterium]|nr:hypothetical protein [Planctomycetota bacterium]
MFRFSMIAVCSAALSISAFGQSEDPMGTFPITSPARHAGTFHVSTGTWTRPASDAAQRGVTEVIYNNTANTDAFTTHGLGQVTSSFQAINSGRIPSTGSAGIANRDNYNISEITVGYCISNNTTQAASLLVSVYGSYIPCSDPATNSCSGEFLVGGLPSATAANIAAGVETCWIVDFDLSGGQEICILGDADGIFHSDLDFDSFGVGLEFDPGGVGGYVGSGINLGPMLAGDRSWTVQTLGVPGQTPGTGGVPGCPVPGAGGGGDTYYGPAECCTPTLGGDNSSGLDTQDLFWIGDRASVGVSAGCYFVLGYFNPIGCNANGGNLASPPASMYIKVAADLTTDCVPQTCAGGGSIVPFCNPANNNSTGGPALLSGNFGSLFETDVHLSVSGGPLPIAASRMLGYMLVGNQNSAPGISISDGQFCLVGNPGAVFGRYNAAGTSRSSFGLFDANGDLENVVNTGGRSGYGFDVPYDLVISGLPATTIMSGNQYHFQCWYRDTLAGPGHSNFSNALSVTFP